MGEITLHVAVRGLQNGCAALLFQPERELGQVAPVAVQRVARQAVFQPQVVAEFVE
jgi:hypothetical protein